jgi:hypothetical protein
MPHRSRTMGLPELEEISDQEVVKRLTKVVEEALESIAKVSQLPVQEVLHIIEEVDVTLLREATQEGLKKISEATGLDSSHITEIFKADRVASVDDIVHRLHEQSRTHRARW